MKNLIVLFVFLSSSLSAQNYDINLLKSINQSRNTQSDPIFKALSNSLAPAVIAIPVGVLSVGILKKDSALKNKGFVIGASLAVAAGITIGMKYGINRPRPFVSYPFINNAVNEHTPSFPSGHTSLAFSTATSLSLQFPKWYVIAPSYLWACSVGYSRMYLGVHYPSDVLAGAVVGAGSSYLSYKVNKWLYNHYRKK